MSTSGAETDPEAGADPEADANQEAGADPETDADPEAKWCRYRAGAHTEAGAESDSGAVSDQDHTLPRRSCEPFFFFFFAQGSVKVVQTNPDGRCLFRCSDGADGRFSLEWTMLFNRQDETTMESERAHG